MRHRLFQLGRQVRVFAARHRGAEGADARHVAVAPRFALLQEQAARLGGAIPVMTIGQTGDVIFQLAQSFGTDAPAVGKVKQAADKIWTLKIEKRAAVNPAAEVKTGPCAIVTASRGLGYSVSVTRGFGRRGLGKYEAAFRENGIDETVLPNLTAVASARWGTDAAAFSVAACAHQRRRRR